MAQLRITARMYIGAPAGRLGLRGVAARRSATWPIALVGLMATSHTCDSLYAIALIGWEKSTRCLVSIFSRYFFALSELYLFYRS